MTHIIISSILLYKFKIKPTNFRGTLFSTKKKIFSFMINRCKVVFLDRDGTINKDKNYIYKKEEFEFIDGSIDALKLSISNLQLVELLS